MNYERIYNELIQKRQKDPINEGYSESHHIKPKSLGGSNNPDNLVRLSSREHFIAHYLLTKIYENGSFEWYKMTNAFLIMKSSSIHNERYFNSRLYEALRGNFSEVMSFIQKGERNSQFGTCWICHIENKLNRKVPKEKLSEFESKGWVKGRNIWNKEVKSSKEQKFKNVQDEVLLIFENYVSSESISLTEFSKELDITQQALCKKMKKYIPNYSDIFPQGCVTIKELKERKRKLKEKYKPLVQ